MDLWLKIALSILGILIFATPAVNYWSRIYKEKRFKSGKEFVAYTFLQFVFDCSVLWFAYSLYQLDTESHSLVPIFILAHAFLFALLTFVPPIMYGFLLLFEKIQRSPLFHKIMVCTHKIETKLLFKNYYHTESEISLDPLSGAFMKQYIVVSYLMCGLLTASGISNDLLISLFKQPNISKNMDEFSFVYSNDLKLYTDIFLMSALSFVFSRVKKKS